MMFKRYTIVSLVIFLTAFNVVGQNKAVQFEDLRSLQAKSLKPVVVLIMTDWCKYCHAMQNSMLKNPKVSSLLRDEFYTVLLNAEEKRNISFAGRIFKHKAGINELAGQLGTINGQISYPTICILTSKNEIIYQHEGYISAQAMLYIFKKIAGR